MKKRYVILAALLVTALAAAGCGKKRLKIQARMAR